MSQPNKHLLYVDDARYMHRVLKLSLPKDFTVECVDNGEDALKLLQRDRFDFIISDINMPNMTGLQLLEKLRQLPDYQTTPVLLISAEDNAEYKQKARTLGASGFLTKPFNPESLERSINYLLSLHNDNAE